MSRRSVSEPPRHSLPRDGSANRNLSLMSLLLALVLFAVVGIALNLASPGSHNAAARVDPPTTTSSPAPTSTPTTAQASHHQKLAKKPVRKHHHHKPAIPRRYVKVSKRLSQETTFNVVSFNALGFSHTATRRRPHGLGSGHDPDALGRRHPARAGRRA